MAGILLARILAVPQRATCLSTLGVVFGLVTMVLAMPAAGQLRSGRVSRELYHDQAQQAPQRIQNAQQARPLERNATGIAIANSRSKVSRNDTRSQVILASGEESILEAVPDDATVPPNTSSAMPERIEHYGSIDYTGNSIGDGGCHNCGSPKCGGLACDIGGCDSFADLAPSCSGEPCLLGCGPIARLLSRLSIRAEVPLFWRRAQGVPLLLTTSPVGTPADVAGEIGQPTTQTLFGNRLIDEDATAGFRITLGTWLGGDCYRGLMFRYWNAGNQDNEFNFNSNSNPIIARPFINVLAVFTNDAQLIAFPGESVGSARVASTSRVDGWDIALRRLAYQDRFTRVDWLVGYQHAQVDESLTIASDTTVTGAVPGLQGSSIEVTDRFETENRFDGLMLGLMSTRQLACWSYEGRVRLGLGNLRREVHLNGSTTTTSAAGVAITEAQGLLVRNTNNQPFLDDTFVVVPEVGLDVGYHLTQNLDFSIGYNYLLIPKVAQAGEQLDDVVNLNDPLTGALRPRLDFDERRYWLHSLNLGMQWRY